MIKLVKGNLLEAPENIIAHQTNCQSSFGSGIAGQIRKKDNTVYTNYMHFCSLFKDKNELLGQVQMVNVASNKYIANIFGQLYYGYDGKQYTSYEALETGLGRLRQIAEEQGLSVALPVNLGSGLGGADWNKVYKIIEQAFDGYDVTLYEL